MSTEIITILHKLNILQSRKSISEESTKNFLIFPFLSYLGYDPSSPEEFEYEYACDLHEHGKRRVDCVIFDEDHHPYIILEAKPLGTDLTNYTGQLKTYFYSCGAAYAILTDGNTYLVFTRDQIDGDFYKRGPAFLFQISALTEESYLVINKISKASIPKVIFHPPILEQNPLLDTFDLYCISISKGDLVGSPTNVAYKRYATFCNEHNDEPICLINWSKLIKARFHLKIIDKRVSGIKTRVFISEDDYNHRRKQV